MKKIVVYGLAGSGKSTTAGIVRDYYTQRGKSVEIVKLAKPLYDLQQRFYATAGAAIRYDDQDQPLLETIATQLRRISETSLADDFRRRLKEVRCDVVVNDDLRDPYVDYPALYNESFVFIRVKCPEELRIRRLQARADKEAVVDSESTRNIDLIQPHYVIMNDSTQVEDLQAKIHAVLEAI